MGKIKQLSFIVIFLLNFTIVEGQNLRNHEDFFNAKIPEFENWLEQFSNNKSDTAILEFNKIYFKNDTTLALKLKMPDKHNWKRLNNKIDSLYKKPVGEILIDKFAFLMDLQVNQCYIIIDGRDAKVKIIPKVDGLVKIKLYRKMGGISGSHDIPIGELENLSKYEKNNSSRTIKAVKTLLEDSLKIYFNEYEAFFPKYKFKVITRLNNKLIITIDNVVDVVLNKGHFEHIRINFTFNTVENVLKMEYIVNVKHAAGILWAPFDSDYVEINSNEERFIDFSLSLKNKIDEILKK